MQFDRPLSKLFSSESPLWNSWIQPASKPGLVKSFSSSKALADWSKSTVSLTWVAKGVKVLSKPDSVVFFKDGMVLRDKVTNSFINTYGDFATTLPKEPDPKDFFYAGEYKGKNLFGVQIDSEKIPSNFEMIPVRDALLMTDTKMSALISRTKYLLNWHKSSFYSGCCGSPTKLSSREIAKICKTCDKTIYPSGAIFVIIFIERAGKFLLARSPHFEKGLYSVLAGFVDAGETLEEAVHREVAEEVGIKVKNLKYFGSQSWPFPCSMGVAFTTEYDSGEIQMDPNEIEDAQWFDPDDLPPLPHPYSISRVVIDTKVGKHLENKLA